MLALLLAAVASFSATNQSVDLKGGSVPALPVISSDKGYVGSASCQDCHPKEYNSWHRSFHRTMTQATSPETVAGKFDNVTIKSDGLDYRVYREGDTLMAEMPDPDVMMYIVQGGKKLSWDQVPRVERPVVMSTGSHHYQTYWVSSPRYPGILQTLPLVYLVSDGRWIPREAAFLRPPDDRGRFITQWNHHCIRCHSTGGNPGLDPQNGQLRTSVAELGIACEACHGPGQEHARSQRELSLATNATTVAQAAAHPLIDPRDLDARRSSELCGQCHGVFVEREEFAMNYAQHGVQYFPGQDLLRTRYYIQYPGPRSSPAQQADLVKNPDFFRERWWEDGTILAGGREYTAMTASACYQRGTLSCLTCHSMHRSDPNDQLKEFASDNAQCTSCHTQPEFNTNLERHTHHAPGSTGSNCLNCHMPHTTYALFKGIRSHQIQSPGIEASRRFGVPNACNLCHLDKTLAWTQDNLAKWYGTPTNTLTGEQRELSAAVLWLLKGHAAQRAIAAWHFGWEPAQKASGTDWLAPVVAPLLEDPYGVVRYIASRSLRTLPDFANFTYDFLAPPTTLHTNVLKATAEWETRRAEGPLQGDQRPLIRADKSLDETLLKRLLSERDDRPVTVKE